MKQWKKVIENYFDSPQAIFSKISKQVGKAANELIPVEQIWLKTATEYVTLTMEISNVSNLEIKLEVGGQRGHLFAVYFREILQVRERNGFLDIIGQTSEDKLVIIRIDKERRVMVL